MQSTLSQAHGMIPRFKTWGNKLLPEPNANVLEQTQSVSVDDIAGTVQ